MLCPCPKLTPLQARLLASISTLALLVLVYWSLSNSHFAYAAELALDGTGQLRDGEDHNWHRILQGPFLEHGGDTAQSRRDTDEAQIEGNDVANNHDAAPGSITVWKYPNDLLLAEHAVRGIGLPQEPGSSTHGVRHIDLRRSEQGVEQLQSRQQTRTIYISANTCQQPLWQGTGTQDVAPPQLTLYVSTKSGDRQVGPGGGDQTVHAFDSGFVNATVNSASGDWYMAVGAPELSSNFSGSWSYDLSVSVDDYFHVAELKTPLYLVDTDSTSALLVTESLTNTNASEATYQQWASMTPPFVMFAFDSSLGGHMGLEKSFCGLQSFVSSNGQIQARSDDLEGINSHVQMNMITRGLGKKPKQQFHLSQLDIARRYRGFLAMSGNSTASGNGVVGGGGQILGNSVDFTTKSDGNCQMVYNLTLCDDLAYAAPGNPDKTNFGNFTSLQQWYDNYTISWYSRFNWTLGQIACNTTSDARYSLAKNCNDCADAYKEWLCAVSVPRCEDFSNQADYLQVRNVGQPFYNNGSHLTDDFLNSNYIPMPGAPTVQGSNAFEQTYNWSFATNRSRNLDIDTDIAPGPYKELLPCDDLCYNLMQSCHAGFNFACPYSRRGLEASYGKRSKNGSLTCNYMGAVYNNTTGTAPSLGVASRTFWGVSGAAVLFSALF